ncbi:MAG: pyridoxal phosphate-dependent aminotransferase [candidate division WS1 bacterium]|jgi:aspartate aminotransferase|nr:pyridoxal phosphate-dependent aminotransferase [candidate division WS1 bacterium]
MKISQRARELTPSPTLAMDSRAKALAAEGVDIISFAVGEPDFPTPPNVVEAACTAIHAGQTKYTPASGIPQLKQAIVAATERDLGLQYDPAQVCVCNGGKHALMNIWQSLVDPGDEVIVFAPYWVSYPPQIELCGGRVVVIATGAESDFQPDLEGVRAAVTDRTIAILINSPSNPAGAIFTRATLRGLVDLAEERNLLIISDEIYKHILFDGREHLSPAQLGADAQARTILADGVAKTYAMTGWRIGWLIAPPEIAKRAGDIQSQETSNPCTPAQYAALEALSGPQESVEEMRAEFERRRDYLVPALNEIPGVTCNTPGGAFYVYPDITAHLGRKLDGEVIGGSLELCEYLLDTAHISTVPGSAFGTEGYLRISFATSMEKLQEGVRRLTEALK